MQPTTASAVCEGFADASHCNSCARAPARADVYRGTDRRQGKLPRVRVFIGRVIFGGNSEVHPVGPKGFDGMLGALFPIAAAQIVGRAVPVAAPADALRMSRAYGYPSYHARDPLTGRLFANSEGIYGCGAGFAEV